MAFELHKKIGGRITKIRSLIILASRSAFYGMAAKPGDNAASQPKTRIDAPDACESEHHRNDQSTPICRKRLKVFFLRVFR